MRYLVAVDSFFPDQASGSARVAFDIVRFMRDRGHQVTVFCRKQKPDAETISQYEGIRVVRFAFPKTRSLDPFKVHKQKMAGVRTARKYLFDMKWDVIHIHLPLYGEIVYEVFGDGPRYVYTVHSPTVMEQEMNWAAQGLPGKIKLLFGKGALRKLEGEILGKVDRIHTLSMFTKEAIDNYYGVGDKVQVIPHWCREGFSREYLKSDARAKLHWPDDARILLSVRRLAPRMGLDIAIRAIAPLLKARNDVYYVVVGAGSMEQELKSLTESLDVRDKIWFLGQIKDNILKRCYEGADLFILPTRALECFGLPVLEAFAYGLPIISTDAAAIPELMKPILPECIVPAGSVEQLRQKVQGYLEDKLSFPTSDELICYVRERYSPEIIIPRMVGLLEG